MTEKHSSRREFIRIAAAGASAALFPLPAISQNAGGTRPRGLKRLDPRLTVTLVETTATFTACPFSNDVIAGLREIAEQQFDYKNVAADGVVMISGSAAGVDPQARTVSLADGTRVSYD